MDRPSQEKSKEKAGMRADEVRDERIPADAGRTLEREEDRGVPRADHNLEENSGSESPRAHE